jgi:hypothetical protein
MGHPAVLPELPQEKRKSRERRDACFAALWFFLDL